MNPSALIVVVNESSAVTDIDAWRNTWCLNYQIQWQFGPLWKLGAQVTFLPKGAPVPAKASILHLLDTLDVQGALGYHDEDGNEVPYGRIGVKTSQENGATLGEVLSHEGLELLVDPHVNLTAYDTNHSRLQAYEVCDPCQGAYDLGSPYGRITGFSVSNFVRPNYFDPNTGTNEESDYLGQLKGAFSLLQSGYVSFTKKLPPEWEQQMGERVNKGFVDNDDRVRRREVIR